MTEEVTQADRELYKRLLGLPEENLANRRAGRNIVSALDLLVEHRTGADKYGKAHTDGSRSGGQPPAQDGLVEALWAMREPTDEMLEAALETSTRFGKPAMKRIWQNMIDAALASLGDKP